MQFGVKVIELNRNKKRQGGSLCKGVQEECVFAFLNRAVRSATICQRPACVVEARPALAGRSAMVNTTPRSFWGFSILSSGYIGNIEFTI